MNTCPKILFTAIIATMLAVTGCNSDNDDDNNFNTNNGSQVDNDGSNNSGDNLNSEEVIRYSLIDNTGVSDSNDFVVYREDYVLRDGSLSETLTNIIGTYIEENDGDFDTYFLAKDFARVVAEEDIDSVYTKNLDVLNNQEFNIDLSYKNQSLILKHGLEFVDISGYTADKPNFELILEDSLLKNVIMPQGSQCVIFAKEGGNKAYYEADVYDDHDDFLSDETIESWLEKRRSDKDYMSDSGVELVGDKNQYKAAHATLRNTYSNSDYIDAAVMIDEKLVSAIYYPKDGDGSNTDITKGEIDCYLFNDTAADYLEAEIKKNVK